MPASSSPSSRRAASISAPSRRSIGLLVEMRDSGRAVFVISADLDEIFSLSDRILVMYRGRIVADLVDRRDQCRGGRPPHGRPARSRRTRRRNRPPCAGRPVSTEAVASHWSVRGARRLASASEPDRRGCHRHRCRRDPRRVRRPESDQRLRDSHRGRPCRLAESLGRAAIDDAAHLHRSRGRHLLSRRPVEYRRRGADADGRARGWHRRLRRVASDRPSHPAMRARAPSSAARCGRRFRRSCASIST